MRLARSFNLCYRYIDDLIVFNNKKFLDYLKEIYPSQLTVEKANKSEHLADYQIEITDRFKKRPEKNLGTRDHVNQNLKVFPNGLISKQRVNTRPAFIKKYMNYKVANVIMKWKATYPLR